MPLNPIAHGFYNEIARFRGLTLADDDFGCIGVAGRTAALLLLLRHEARKRHAREDLIWLLWDEVPSTRLRHSLSQLIYSLKTNLAITGVEADRDSVWLDPINFTYDVEDAARLTKGQEAEAAGNLCTGRFLEAVPVLAGRNFDDWQSQASHEVNGAAVRTLLGLSSIAESRGDWKAARLRSEQLLRYDPVHGEAFGRLLRSIALTEGNHAALATTDRVRSIYHAWELPIPSDLGGILAIVERGACDPGSPVVVQGPFLGRQREFTALTRTWSAALRSSSQLAQITGIAGIGKTRLARQFLRWCAIKGARVLAADCSPAEERLAYTVLSTALRDGIRTEDVARLEPVWCRRLAYLAPELFPRTVQRVAIDPERQHRELFEAVARLLTSLTDRQPVVVMIDNVQWIDDSTAWIVHFLLHRLRDRPLLVVITRRSGTSFCSERLRVLLENAAEHQNTQIELSAFPLELSKELAVAQAAREGVILTAAENEAVATASSGVPFRIIQGVMATAARRIKLSPPTESSRPAPRHHSPDFLIDRLSNLRGRARITCTISLDSD